MLALAVDVRPPERKDGQVEEVSRGPHGAQRAAGCRLLGDTVVVLWCRDAGADAVFRVVSWDDARYNF